MNRSLQLNQEMGELAGIAFVRDRFARLALANNQPDRVLRLAGAAATLREQAGVRPATTVQRLIDGHLQAAHHALGPLGNQVLAAGRQLTLMDAIQDVQSMVAATVSAETPEPAPLSARELQVAELASSWRWTHSRRRNFGNLLRAGCSSLRVRIC